MLRRVTFPTTLNAVKLMINFVRYSGLCFQIGNEQQTKKDSGFFFYKHFIMKQLYTHICVRCELIMET